MRALALILLLTASACAPAAIPSPAASSSALDCSKSYAALSAEILAIPGVGPTPRSPGEPYRYYATPNGRLAFVFTETGAPGHPAIVQQVAVRRGGAIAMANTGCAYGERAGFDALIAYLDGLKTR